MSTFTHSELVKIAAKWAEPKHRIIITERGAIHELPDVLAIGYGFSTLIEVKISRSDFLRDKRKLTRRDGDFCAGNYRIYCVPKGLITENDIPDDWGLLEVYPSGKARLKVNIYKYSRPNTIWWHEDSVEGLKAEKHILMNHFLYPKIS